MRTLFCLIALMFFALPVAAGESPWASADYVQARLITGKQDGKELKAGLQVRLAEGWHAYWKNPGDAGLAPTLNWKGSENFAQAQIHWPVPKRFDEMGLQTFGYGGSVLFPLTVELENPEQPAKLSLSLDIMVCNEICVPQSLALELEDLSPSTQAGLIDLALKKVPATENLPSLKIETAVLGPEGLVITAYAQNGFDKTDVFVDAGDFPLTAPPEIELTGDSIRTAILKIKVPEGVDNLAKELEGRDVSVTLINRNRAVERVFSF